MNFTSLGLSSPLLRAIDDLGYTTPTLVQTKAIPGVLNGRDLLASSQTGSGKTASFLLPLMQNISEQPLVGHNRTKILILTPTRELAAQVYENAVQYSRYLPLRSQIVIGGVKINPQMKKLCPGVEILIATPGRLLDLHQQRAIRFDDVQAFVLDEADRMLDMGFIHDIRRIIKLLPSPKQTLMFSATFSNEIRTLAKSILHNPLEIDTAPRNSSVQSIK